MILIVTHSKDISADLVIRHLLMFGCKFLRLDTDKLGSPACHFAAKAEAELQLDGQSIRRSEITAIWARRFALPEALRCVNSEYVDFVKRELGVVMDAFLEGGPNVFQINSSNADRQAGNRILQSQRAKNIGLAVPEALVTQDHAAAQLFLERYPQAVCKALSFGRISSWPNTETVAYTSNASSTMPLDGLAFCPTLFQQKISKRFDWRITTVGDRIFSAKAECTQDVLLTDWRQDKDSAAKFVRAEIPKNIQDQLLKLATDSGIVYGAHDLVETEDGEFFFLETNPAGQWGWIELTTGLPIGHAIAEELAAHSSC